jgi:hypothetical protein
LCQLGRRNRYAAHLSLCTRAPPARKGAGAFAVPPTCLQVGTDARNLHIDLLWVIGRGRQDSISLPQATPVLPSRFHSLAHASNVGFVPRHRAQHSLPEKVSAPPPYLQPACRLALTLEISTSICRGTLGRSVRIRSVCFHSLAHASNVGFVPRHRAQHRNCSAIVDASSFGRRIGHGTSILFRCALQLGTASMRFPISDSTQEGSDVFGILRERLFSCPYLCPSVRRLP